MRPPTVYNTMLQTQALQLQTHWLSVTYSTMLQPAKLGKQGRERGPAGHKVGDDYMQQCVQGCPCQPCAPFFTDCLKGELYQFVSDKVE